MLQMKQQLRYYRISFNPEPEGVGAWCRCPPPGPPYPYEGHSAIFRCQKVGLPAMLRNKTRVDGCCATSDKGGMIETKEQRERREKAEREGREEGIRRYEEVKGVELPYSPVSAAERKLSRAEYYRDYRKRKKVVKCPKCGEEIDLAMKASNEAG